MQAGKGQIRKSMKALANFLAKEFRGNNLLGEWKEIRIVLRPLDTDQLRIQNASKFGISVLNQKSFCNDYYVNEHKEPPSFCSIPDSIYFLRF